MVILEKFDVAFCLSVDKAPDNAPDLSPIAGRVRYDADGLKGAVRDEPGKCYDFLLVVDGKGYELAVLAYHVNDAVWVSLVANGSLPCLGSAFLRIEHMAAEYCDVLGYQTV